MPRVTRQEISHRTKKSAWQIGARVYLTAPRTKWRPALSLFYGPVYRYQVEFPDTTIVGIPMCITPAVTFEHDVGDPNGFVFTYGIGPIFSKEAPKRATDAIEKLTGGQTLISLSAQLGINFQLKIKKKLRK